MVPVFDTEALQNDLRQKKDYIDACLLKYMNAPDTYPPIIHQAMHYAVFNGGKRLRPIMVLEGAHIAGGSPESVAPTACALELIHTYSLVHDDLPAMDDDDYRRGKPTCHKVFGEANAILAGDALLTEAFALIAANAGIPGIDPAAVTRVVSEVSRAAGSRGMVGGQVLDLEAEGQSVDYRQLRNLHRLKTAELFRAALLAGAILHHLDQKGIQALEQYAYNFGLAFQITDDILDVTGEAAILGKPVGSDVKNAKTTYPRLFGLEKSQQMAQESADACLEYLAAFGEEADFLRRLSYFVVHREN